jgi:hypothetical protein
MTNDQNILLIIAAALLIALGCGGETKKEEIKSGRVKFVQTLRYGRAGIHSGRGWTVEDRNLFVNDREWSPEGIKVNDDIADCEASPNEMVEALKCYSFSHAKATTFILRMNGEKPEWIMASELPIASGGDDLGEWTGEGHWLLFRNYFFNVETSEKKEVKGLPDDPEKRFRANSPDLETIVYEETCFLKRSDLPDTEAEKERDRQCKIFDEHREKGIAAFWLIDAQTGNVKILEVKKEKYDWLDWQTRKFSSKSDWLDYFQKQLIWEKDTAGKYQLKFPD